MTDISDPTKLIERLPTPEEVEQIMIQRELETQKALDGRAQMFALYMPRLKGQMNFMSKKQLIKFVTHLCKSEHTKDEEVNKAMSIIDKLNLNSIRRVIGNVIESPLNEQEIKTFSVKEKNVFDMLEELLSQKYVTYIMNYVNNPPKEGETPRQIQELVTYLPKYLFNKNIEQVEKDAFATANQIMLTKTLMMQHTLLEFLNEEEKKNNPIKTMTDEDAKKYGIYVEKEKVEKEKNESVGSVEASNEENTTGTSSDSRVKSI